MATKTKGLLDRWSWIALLFLVTAAGIGACSGDERCLLTDEVYCTDSNTYRVDSCGELAEHLEHCACGCNVSHTGCRDCDCTPDCSGKECGDDGCGGSCGTCPRGESCNTSGQCVAGCTPDCSGKECGPDGCDGSCGTCPAGESCNASGQCESGCTPDCGGKECGPDGCGDTCGTCPDGEACDDAGRCVEATLSLQARAVGAYTQVGSTCQGSSPVMTGYGAFLCPGGKIRGAGQLLNATNLWCGDFVVEPPTYPDCSDKLGCFPRVDATIKDTLIYGGQQDVEYGYEFSMYQVTNEDGIYLYRSTRCSDDSDAFIVLERIAYDVTDNYCHSDACPQDGGSSGGSGSCGTDCDCGHCWYCENDTCYYGGEGPYGCYRGCPW